MNDPATMPLPIRGLHHIALLTALPERSEAFYRDVLGFEVRPRPPFSYRGAWLYGWGVQIHLIETEDADALFAGADGTGQQIRTRSNHLAFAVEDREQVQQRLEAHGIAYRCNLNAAGIHQVFCQDPDGHHLEFAQYGDPRESVVPEDDQSTEPLTELGPPARNLGISLSPDQERQLAEYCRLLWKWNEQLNLTRHIDFETFAERDLLDCVHLARQLPPGERVLDVGSGGGVPGVPLAILRPDLKITLSESVGKKARALESMVGSLHLSCRVVADRAEQILEHESFDVLVARAVGPMWKILHWFRRSWDSIGRMLLIKGPRWVQERGEARHRGYLKPLELRRVASYQLPDSSRESVILCVQPKGRNNGN